MSSQPGEYDGGFGVAAAVMTAIGQQNRSHYPDQDGPGIGRRFDIMHQIPIGAIQVPITAGSGVYQMNDLLMPKAGYMWSIRNLTASGYTAGTVAVYKGGFVSGGAYSGGGQPFPFSAAGAATIGRGSLLLDQGDALIVVCGTAVPGGVAITLAPGFTGVQINGAADCFERWYLPRYIG